MASVGSEDGDIGFQNRADGRCGFCAHALLHGERGFSNRRKGIEHQPAQRRPGEPERHAEKHRSSSISPRMARWWGNNTSFGTTTDHTLLALRDWLQATQGFGGEDPVIIRPNSDTKHERIIDVLNACAAAGIKNLTFS